MEREREVRIFDYLLKGIGIDRIRDIEKETMVVVEGFYSWIPYKYGQHVDFDDEEINKKYAPTLLYLAETYDIMFVNAFKKANEICVKNGFSPLYEHPDDVMETYEYHKYIMQYRKESECNALMQCSSYDDYVSDKKL